MADTFSGRLKGLLGRGSLPRGSGLLLRPCRSIHTVGMRFPIDVAFVDSQNRIRFLIHRMAPCRFSRTVRDAAYVIEAPAGTFAETGTVPGDTLVLMDL